MEVAGARALIEHEPWVGPLYVSEGIRGQRLGIVGYSAWTPDDHADYTVESVRNVVDGTWPNVAFFNSIASYFAIERADFYNRVVLFEFVPCSVGAGDQRYATATPEQTEAGRRRTLRLAHEHAIDKLVVFSRKAWRSMPPTVEAARNERVHLPGTNFEMGHYDLSGHRVALFGLRHPQYAPRQLMRDAVEGLLAL